MDLLLSHGEVLKYISVSYHGFGFLFTWKFYMTMDLVCE